jgi:hypothetical protein
VRDERLAGLLNGILVEWEKAYFPFTYLTIIHFGVRLGEKETEISGKS